MYEWSAPCQECGKVGARDEMKEYADYWVCADGCIKKCEHGNIDGQCSVCMLIANQ